MSDYFTQLGLESDPFAANAMPAFFFVGGQRRFLAQRAVQLVYFSGSMVLLLGASGAGKTRMLDEIVADLGDVADVCRIDATVLMDCTEIRRLLAADAGLPAGAAVTNAELVSAFQHSRPADGDPSPVLLLVDAAHLLSIETLIELTALTRNAGGRVRLLLAGESDLAASWQQANCGEAAVLQIEPLSAAETADYVHTRLQAAGYSQPLAEEVLSELYLQSGGNIGAIHRLVPALLLPAAGAQRSTRTWPRWSQLPQRHIAIAAVLLAGVILLLLNSGGDSDGEVEAVSVPVDGTRTQQSVPLSLPQQSAPSNAATLAPEAPVAPPPAATLPAPAPAPAPAPVAAKPATPLPKNAPAATVPDTKAVPVNGAYGDDERALLALPSGQVMLQLIGAESRGTIDKFATGAARGVKLYAYRTQLRGKPWYIAVTGPYADAKAARAAIAALPPAVRKQQPWPRSVANIQSDIRAHGGRR